MCEWSHTYILLFWVLGDIVRCMRYTLSHVSVQQKRFEHEKYENEKNLKKIMFSILIIVSLIIDVDAQTNMNVGGVPYDVANRVGQEYSTNFQENVKNKVEYFDVYGEVRTRYSQGTFFMTHHTFIYQH